MAKLEQVEGLVGWRYCHLLAGQFLASPQQAEAWLERVTPKATCANRFHKIPSGEICNDGYGCGYYAMYKRADVDKQLRSYSSEADWVLVKVSALGETELHREGFRSERLRVDEIWVKPGTDGKVLAGRYGVPVYEEEPCKSESELSASPAFLGRANQLMSQLQSLVPLPIPPPPLPGNQSPSAPPASGDIVYFQADFDGDTKIQLGP